MLRSGRADLTIAGGIREFDRATPAAIAVRDGSAELTFAAPGERSSRLANALMATGLTAGDRVALLSGNRLEYPEIPAGVAKAGLVLVPVNPRLTAPPLEFACLESARLKFACLEFARLGFARLGFAGAMSRCGGQRIKP
jgi:long-chain acyl-CoA synthetase